MAIGDIIVGIDIGSSKVSLVVGEVNNFNQIELVYTVEHKCKGIKKTKIIDEDDARDTNIRITCNAINGTIIKNGEEFSFNKVAGNPTPDRGYKKAGVFIDGELKKGYGGGNCQVSTTIYNAVNKIDAILLASKCSVERIEDLELDNEEELIHELLIS